MAYPKKEKRNKDLIQKRNSNPKKWTWRTLADHFNISRPMAVKIYQKYNTKV